MLTLALLVSGFAATAQTRSQSGNVQWDKSVPRTFTEPDWWSNGIVFVGNWEGLAFRTRTGGQGFGGLSVDLDEQFNREHSEESVINLEKAGVNLVLLHFYKTGLTSDHDDIEIAKKYTLLCHKHNIRVGLYIGGTIFAETVLRDIPEAKYWVSYNENGEPLRYGHSPFRYLPDFNSPGYVAYMKSVIRIAITELHPDLIHFDNFTLPAPPETANTPEVNRRFRAFLHAKYPAPAQLKARFGFADISAFTVPAWHGIPSPGALSPIEDPLMEEWTDFRCHDLAAYYGKLADYIRSLDKNVVVELNPGGISGINRAWLNGIDHARLTPHGSVFWTEEQNEAQVTDKGILISKIRSYKLARHLNETLFSYTGPMRANAKLHSWRLLMAESMAYNRNSLGDLGSPLDAAAWPTDLLTYIRFYRDHNQHYRDTHPVADVAILRSFPSMSFNSRGSQLQTTLMEQLLIQYKIPFEIIADQDLINLAHYRAVILADQESLTAKAVQQLGNYVRNGGGLVATGNTSLYTEWHRIRKDFGLAEAFNVHVGTAAPAYQQNTYGQGRVAYLNAVVPKDKTVATADLTPAAGGYGAAFWSLPENAADLVKAIRFAVGSPLSVETENSPLTTTMEITDNSSQTERVLHWLNYDLNTVAPPAPVSVALPEGKHAHSIEFLSPDQPGQTLKFHEENGRVRFTLPETIVYNMAIIHLE